MTLTKVSKNNNKLGDKCKYKILPIISTVYSAIYAYLFCNERLEYYHYLLAMLMFFGFYLFKKKNDLHI